MESAKQTNATVIPKGNPFPVQGRSGNRTVIKSFPMLISGRSPITPPTIPLPSTSSASATLTASSTDGSITGAQNQQSREEITRLRIQDEYRILKKKREANLEAKASDPNKHSEYNFAALLQEFPLEESKSDDKSKIRSLTKLAAEEKEKREKVEVELEELNKKLVRSEEQFDALLKCLQAECDDTDEKLLQLVAKKVKMKNRRLQDIEKRFNPQILSPTQPSQGEERTAVLSKKHTLDSGQGREHAPKIPKASCSGQPEIHDVPDSD